jgi:RNA polymerase sigma-70 factor (ECF subfamily)
VRRTDADLMRSAALGHREAFTELMARHLPRLVGFALSLVGDRRDAQDVAQETFIEAYKHVGRFDGRATVVPWLLGIAANRCRMLGRRKGPSDVSLEALSNTCDGAGRDAHINPGAAMAPSDLRVDVQRAVGGLPAKYRVPLLLRFQQGLTYEEIALVLDMPVGSAAARLHRAKALLRDRLSHLDSDDEAHLA